MSNENQDQTLSIGENDREQLKNALVEVTHCLARVDSEREQIKEILEAAEEKFGVKKKLLRKIANTMYKQDYANVRAEQEHFETLYETVVSTTSTSQQGGQ